MSIKLQSLELDDEILNRVAYYNALDDVTVLDSTAQSLNELSFRKGSKVYYFDLYEYSRYFDDRLKGHFLYGDNIIIPDHPSLVKSRPIHGDNKNAVILKWNKIRHFIFVKNERKQYLDKKDKLVFRGNIHDCQPHRIAFMEMHFDNPICDIGKVNQNKLHPEWTVDWMSIDDQLEYKFILCLEGADVATNLKWVMSSQSLAIMPRPKYETWFMEGKLIPDYHYIEINDDYSNLNQKLNYYINHPKKGLQIIANANKYVKQFQDKKREDIISLFVLKKYFEKTGQRIPNL